MRLQHLEFVTVCGEAATEDEALAMVQETQPDLILVDISLKVENGVDVIKRVKSDYPSMKMLVVSGYHDSFGFPGTARLIGYWYNMKQRQNVCPPFRQVPCDDGRLKIRQRSCKHRNTERPG